MADRQSGQVGVLQQLTVQENIDQEEVVNIITDLFLAAADTVSKNFPMRKFSLFRISRIGKNLSVVDITLLL